MHINGNGNGKGVQWDQPVSHARMHRHMKLGDVIGLVEIGVLTTIGLSARKYYFENHWKTHIRTR